MATPELTLGFSVLAERASSIALPEPISGCEIIVAVQGGPAPVALQRSDVAVIELPTRGVAKSRNAVIELAQGEILLFADDDSTVLPAGVEELRTHFRAHPGHSIVTGRAIDPTGSPRKNYPRRPKRLTSWNSAKFGTIELGIRQPTALAGVRFDEDFGAGTRTHLGDEYIFIVDALRAGLKGSYVPIDLAVHPTESSGVGDGRSHEARVRAVVLRRVFGRWAPLARLLFVLRRPTRFASLATTVRFICGRLNDGGLD